jgi:L-asparaginase II
MPAPLVQVVRSGVVESVHLGDVAVCHASGRLLASVGDPDRVAFARSCMKPIQGAVSIGAIDASLTDADVAIVCSSHNGEPVHVRAVRRVLRRSSVPVGALRNPAGWPMDPEAAGRVARPAPIYHDCSGNHAGILGACVGAGWPIETYRSRGHPHHRRVLPLVRALAGAAPVVGVDGCGIPVHGLPLRRLATMYARLAAPPGTTYDAELGRVTSAMRAEPYLVGGRDRDDTELMAVTPDLVVKEGAEALTCAVSLEAGVGVALKVHDGGYRAAGPAMIAVLSELGLLAPGARRRLRPRLRPVVRGGGRPVGHLEPILTLSAERA